MWRFIFLCVSNLIVLSASAQVLNGSIVNQKEEPISFATIYIKEASSGIISDDQGEFQSTLEKGTYTLEVSALGYEKKIVPVTIADKETRLRIVLSEKTYLLDELIVRPGNEDPAYPVMRKVIAHAPYHLRQVKSYESNVYLKGTFKVEKIPALIKIQIQDKEMKEMVGKLFVVESQNEVNYHQPDQYKQHVVALSSTIPTELGLDNNIPLSIITNNIYSPSAFGGLLSPGSFSVYKFRLEDIYSEGSHQIYKIRVIPKKKSGQLVSGWLYIVDEEWNIQQANFSFSQMGITIRFNLSYNEIKPGAFLPTAYDMSVHLDVMGLKGNGQFYASIQYKQLELNTTSIRTSANKITTEKSTTASNTKQTAKQQKNIKKLEELATKEQLTTREAYKMAKLIEATTESDEIKAQKRRLEERPLDSMIIVTRDSLALLRDSTFWQKHRQLPLRNEELQSYIQHDSLKTLPASERDSTKKIGLIGVLLGKQIKMSEQVSFRYDGLLRACPEYNFVDGFWLGQQVQLGLDFPKKQSLTITPSVHYLTARKDFNWSLENRFNYDPIRRGELTLSIGNTTADYAGTNGTNRLINSFASLFFAENSAKLYQKRFAYIAHQIDLAHALQFTVYANYEKRNRLENNTSYHFFGRQPDSNQPDNFLPMPDHTSFRTGAELQYTPRYHYRIWKGQKIYLYSNYPTFTLKYERGIPSKGQDASFEKVEANIAQSVRLNIFNRIQYTINAGIFPSSKTIDLPDYKHFNINELLITSKSLKNHFNLLDNYQYITNDKWLQGDIEFASDYLLLKHIGFMQRFPLDESLHLRSLWIPGQNYTEFGYSIGIGDLGRVGIFAGLDNGQYDRIGCTISIPLLQFLSGNR